MSGRGRTASAFASQTPSHRARIPDPPRHPIYGSEFLIFLEIKTSIAFALKNVPGALFKALSVFALRDISLSKIESRPMRGHPWEYVFFVDILCGDDEAARNALRQLGEIAEFVKVLGIYPAAKV
jgi:prephenate dehydratase